MTTEASAPLGIAIVVLIAAVVARVAVMLLEARRPRDRAGEARPRRSPLQLPLWYEKALNQGRATRRLVLPELRQKPLGVPSIVLRRPPPVRHPIVLAHGYMGFDSIGLRHSRREYF